MRNRKGQPKERENKKGLSRDIPLEIDRSFADSIDRTFASREMCFEIGWEEF